MEQHGSESFFVIGEGLLGESGGGRKPTVPPAAIAATRRRFASRGWGPRAPGAS